VYVDRSKGKPTLEAMYSSPGLEQSADNPSSHDGENVGLLLALIGYWILNRLKWFLIPSRSLPMFSLIAASEYT